MKESKDLVGFEPTAVRGKWFEVNNLNHPARLYKISNETMKIVHLLTISL
jgi:hypothetical protein